MYDLELEIGDIYYTCMINSCLVTFIIKANHTMMKPNKLSQL